MTNADYIRSAMTDADMAMMLANYTRIRPNLTRKAYNAWSRWAESASSNHGNMVKGDHGRTHISEDPSVWLFENWAFPDGTWKRMGRTMLVSVQVWLSQPYRPEEWEDE